MEKLIAEAKRRGFKPTTKPYYNEVQKGYVVEGVVDFITHVDKDGNHTGSGWTYGGWVFETEAQANEFHAALTA